MSNFEKEFEEIGKVGDNNNDKFEGDGDDVILWFVRPMFSYNPAVFVGTCYC